VIAETLVAAAENVQKAVTLLCEAAGSGDLAAAKALVPYLDQALGKPTERHELRVPSSVEELEQLSDAELERLVAQGRAKRWRSGLCRSLLGIGVGAIHRWAWFDGDVVADD
jgi:hypothetical protein